MPTHRSLSTSQLDRPPLDDGGRAVPLATGALSHRLRRRLKGIDEFPTAADRRSAKKASLGEVFAVCIGASAFLGYLVGHAT